VPDLPTAIDFWVVYRYPLDRPTVPFVVRCHSTLLDGSGLVVVDPTAHEFPSLEATRTWLRKKRLTSIGRNSDDDPVIVEVWI
jgi:hypothetical protein